MNSLKYSRNPIEYGDQKMRRKMKISIVVFAALLLGILVTNQVIGSTSIAGTNSLSTQEEPSNLEIAENIESLKEMVPETFEETELQRFPLRARYLMYTHDGTHIMWGYYGTGRFTGKDNLGKRCWGIYGKGVFAGFYENEFFWGRYCNGTWKAQDLFKPGETHGKYILFPMIVPEALMIEPTETEPRTNLDKFISAINHISNEAYTNPEIIQEAPHNMSVGRVDDVLAARKPVLSFRMKDT